MGDDLAFKINEKDFERFSKEDPADKSNKWKQSFYYPEKDGVRMTMYEKPIPELKGKNLYRTLMTIKDCQIEHYKHLIRNYTKHSKENKQFKEFTVISRDAELFTQPETNSFVYMRNKIPLCSDRDLIINSRSLTYNDGNTVMFIQNTCEHPDYPKRKGCVRMTINKCIKVEQVGNDICSEELCTFDMGGYFPSRMMNMMVAGSIKAGVPLFKKQLEEAKQTVLAN